MYRFFKLVCILILNIFSRWKVEGREHIPPQGPLILVCNHTSYWDPVLVGCAMTREVRFMAKAELFSIPVLNLILHVVGAFPIKRGQSDRTALRTALKLLKDNEVIGIFPEGTRSKTGELLPFKSGVNMLAYKADCPILPMAVINARKVLLGWWHPVKVIFGKPIFFSFKDSRPSREELEELNEIIRQAVQDLLDSQVKVKA
ncbi:MAG: lysophospholipid acyltransferase family protein [Bacillota bacterium]|nr:1-acyl-sn-glycerol-3-phosphate acyltransferase [Clostridia bacterium]